MKNWKKYAILAAAIALFGVMGCLGASFLTGSREEAAVPDVVSDSVSATKSLFAYDSVVLMQSYRPEMAFFENFKASYRDQSFTGKYQLVFPLENPYDTLGNSKFNRLLLSALFGKNAPKTVNRKSIQAALDGMQKKALNTTHKWWRDSKARHGKRWREEVCGCTGYFYAMPSGETDRWISFQQIQDYRCGGNGGPGERYYTIVKGGEPYIMDTTAFVPNFREKLIEMIADNALYNYYWYDDVRDGLRDEIRQATAKQFGGNFQPSLTLTGVKFLFDTWALPNTCHADGRIPVIVPYTMIREIFTEKFKKDIGLR